MKKLVLILMVGSLFIGCATKSCATKGCSKSCCAKKTPNNVEPQIEEDTNKEPNDN